MGMHHFEVVPRGSGQLHRGLHVTYGMDRFGDVERETGQKGQVGRKTAEKVLRRGDRMHHLIRRGVPNQVDDVLADSAGRGPHHMKYTNWAFVSHFTLLKRRRRR